MMRDWGVLIALHLLECAGALRDGPLLNQFFPNPELDQEYEGILVEYFTAPLNPPPYPSFQGTAAYNIPNGGCGSPIYPCTTAYDPSSAYTGSASPVAPFEIEDYTEQFPERDQKLRVYARREQLINFTGTIYPLSPEEALSPQFQRVSAMVLQRPMLIRYSGWLSFDRNVTLTTYCYSGYCPPSNTANSSLTLYWNSNMVNAWVARIVAEQGQYTYNNFNGDWVGMLNAYNQQRYQFLGDKKYRFEIEVTTTINPWYTMVPDVKFGFLPITYDSPIAYTCKVPRVVDLPPSEVEALQNITFANASINFGWVDLPLDSSVSAYLCLFTGVICDNRSTYFRTTTYPGGGGFYSHAQCNSNPQSQVCEWVVQHENERYSIFMRSNNITGLTPAENGVLDLSNAIHLMYMDVSANPLHVPDMVLPYNMTGLVMLSVQSYGHVTLPDALQVLAFSPPFTISQYPTQLLLYYCGSNYNTWGTPVGVCIIPPSHPLLVGIIVRTDYVWDQKSIDYPSLRYLELIKPNISMAPIPRTAEETLPANLSIPNLWFFHTENTDMVNLPALQSQMLGYAVNSTRLVNLPTTWSHHSTIMFLHLCGTNVSEVVSVSDMVNLQLLSICFSPNLKVPVAEQLEAINTSTLPNIRVINLHANMLYGPLPDTPPVFVTYPYVYFTHLELGANNISNNIPEVRNANSNADVSGSMRSLSIIPNAWWSFPSNAVLNLANNYLFGYLPDFARNITTGNSTSYANISFRLRLEGNAVWCSNDTITGFPPDKFITAACIPPVYGIAEADRILSYYDLKALRGSNTLSIGVLTTLAPSIQPAFAPYPATVYGTSSWKSLLDMKWMSVNEAGLNSHANDMDASMTCDLRSSFCSLGNNDQVVPGDFWFLIFITAPVYEYQPIKYRLGPYSYSLVEKCSPGFGTPSLGATTCSICADGTYSMGVKSNDTATCKVCPGGTSSSSSTSTSFCNDCLPGSFSLPRAPACTQCPAGSKQNDTKATSCDACTLGTFSSSPGSTRCEVCPIGQFTQTNGSNVCIPCPVEGYNNRTGMSACSNCPINSASVFPGATSLKSCKCVEGSYNVSGKCTLCPSGAECEGLDALPKALPGWWRSDPIPSGAFTFSQCVPTDACLGDVMCAEAYTGAACSECIPLKSHRNNGICEMCPHNAGAMWFLLLVVFVCLCLVLLRWGSPPHTRLNSISIAVSNAQLISIFASFRVAWPAPTRNLLNLFTVVNFNVDVFSPECSTPMDYWTKWTAQLLLPLYFIIVFGVIFLFTRIKWFDDIFDALMIAPVQTWPNRACRFLRRGIKKFKDLKRGHGGTNNEMGLGAIELVAPGGDQTTLDPGVQVKDLGRQLGAAEVVGVSHDQLLRWRFLYSFLIVLTTCYTFLMHLSSQPSNCVKVDENVWMLAVAPDKQCYTAEWKKFYNLSIFFSVLYGGGIPILVMVVLWYGRVSKGGYKSLHFRLKFGLFTDPYRQQFYYWELVRLGRNLAIVLAVDLSSYSNFSGKEALQALVALFVLVIFMALHEFISPYEFSWDNRLTFTWNFVTLLTVFEALVIGDPSLPLVIVQSYVVLLILSISFALFFTLVVLFKEFHRRQQRELIAQQVGRPFELVEDWERQVVETTFPKHHEGVWRKLRTVDPPLRVEVVQQLAQGKHDILPLPSPRAAPSSPTNANNNGNGGNRSAPNSNRNSPRGSSADISLRTRTSENSVALPNTHSNNTNNNNSSNPPRGVGSSKQPTLDSQPESNE